MPKSKGITLKFYDRDGKDYPFFGRDEQDCINRAARWARDHNLKLYRRKS